jgi:hypothetical protein
MLVETYEAHEVEEQTIQDHEECIGLIESLGLIGQKELINPDKTNKFPYRKMTAEESFVYGLLLPKNCIIEEFKESQIPLRVLQIYAHAKTLEFFTSFEVLFSPNSDEKDPVLIGKKQGNSSWEFQRFLLARWGEVLEPFEELKIKVMKIYREQLKGKYTEAFQEAKSKLASLEEFTDEMLLSDKNKPYGNTFSL